MAGLDLLSKEDDPNIVIKAPTLDATRFTSYFAGAVAIATPILAFVTGQPEPVQAAALSIMLVAIPSIAFVVAADILARSYAEAHYTKPDPTADSKPDSSAPRAFAMGGGDVQIRVSGDGQDPFRLVAVRWDPETSKWMYWVARKGTAKWVEESKVDEVVL